MLTPEQALQRLGRRMRVTETGCWIYPAKTTTNGYVQVYYQGKRNTSLHRLMYEHYCGPIPEGHHLHHVCENRACANPAHLRPLTLAQHFAEHARQRAAIRAALPPKEKPPRPPRRPPDRCPHGHPYTAENSAYPGKKGIRICRTCHRLREQRRRWQSVLGVQTYRGSLSEEQKAALPDLYQRLGSLRAVAAVVGVEHRTIRKWLPPGVVRPHGKRT